MKYLKRYIDEDLKRWSESKNRKPLLLRGARQVGKSSAVKQLGCSFTYFVEVNFGSNKAIHEFFKGDLNPLAICEKLSLYYNIPILPGKRVCCFSMKYSNVLRPFLHSDSSMKNIRNYILLQQALCSNSHYPNFPLAVGRVRSLFMYPLSFNEFLMAHQEDRLLNAKKKATYNQPLPTPIPDWNY